MEQILDYFSGTLGKVELFGTIFSVICVWLAARGNIWTWFWGILGVLCFGYLFFQFGLYSDSLLQLAFYLPLQFVGWWYWKKTDTTTVFSPNVMNWQLSVCVFLGVLVAALGTGYVMHTYTDASFPYLDAYTTWLSIAAQILMLRKYLESWFYWIFMDLIAINIYYAKGLIVTSGLYVVFLVLASYGLWKWWNFRKEFS